MNFSDLVGWFLGVTFLAPNKHKDFCIYIRDLSSFNINRKEVAYAINGYFEVLEVDEKCKWEQEVRAHLSLVFSKVVNVPSGDPIHTPLNPKTPNGPGWPQPFPGIYPDWPSERKWPGGYPTAIC